MSGAAGDVVVLGGGAAGMFCAFHAARRGRRVRVLERADRVGKKILMSGGGRCNFTNRKVSAAHFLSANPHFCKSALARYTPADFIDLVERHGIAYHEKELGQLFCDDSSKQIVAMLVDECREAGVRIDTGVGDLAVEREGAGFQVRAGGERIAVERLVVATGGLSVPTLGGSAYGYELARQFGHTVLPTRAGLVPLTLSGKPLEDWSVLSGLSTPVSAQAEGPVFENALLFTHRGLSGPALLQVSSYWQPGGKLRVDLLPGRDGAGWLARAQAERPTVELVTVLAEALPRRLAQRWCELLAPSRPLNRYKKDELRAIAAKLHDWPIVPSGTEGYRTAEVTLGGVDTREVSSATFESRRVPGLHFIGEVLDVTGWLGGYNFQWAWASAHACAQAL